MVKWWQPAGICPRELGGAMFAHYLPLTFPKSYPRVCIIGNSLRTKWLHYIYDEMMGE